MATVRQAQAWLVPDGAAAEGRELALSYRWDADYPRRDGFAEFHLDLPPPLAPGPQALLLTRTGNQFEVLVEDAVIYPKNRNYPSAWSAGGGVGRPIWPTIR